MASDSDWVSNEAFFAYEKLPKTREKVAPQKTNQTTCRFAIPQKKQKLAKRNPPSPPLPGGGVPFWQFSFALALFSRWSQPENRF